MKTKTRISYPDGILAIYDNGGLTIDRYFVAFTPDVIGGEKWFTTLLMSATPSGPQGVGATGQCRRKPKRMVGERAIEFSDLPEACQRLVRDLIGGAA